MIERREKLEKDFEKRRKVLEQYLKSAPFTKF